MSDYAKLSFGFTYSGNSDYSDPLHNLSSAVLPPYEIAPDEVAVYKIEATSGGTTIALSDQFSSVTLLFIKHLDVDDDIVANYDDTDGVARDQRIIPGSVLSNGGILAVSDVDPTTNLTLTSDSADRKCLVIVCGS